MFIVVCNHGIVRIGIEMTQNKTPNFQETLKRMLESPPKENKPFNHSETESDKKEVTNNPAVKK